MSDLTLRMEAALLLLMAISLTFFLAYPTVWEYQYAGVLPVAAILLLVRKQRPFYSAWLNALTALAACVWLPSLYFLREGAPVDAATLTLIRIDRIVPVALLFVLMVAALVKQLLSATQAGPLPARKPVDTVPAPAGISATGT